MILLLLHSPCNSKIRFFIHVEIVTLCFPNWGPWTRSSSNKWKAIRNLHFSHNTSWCEDKLQSISARAMRIIVVRNGNLILSKQYSSHENIIFNCDCFYIKFDIFCHYIKPIYRKILYLIIFIDTHWSMNLIYRTQFIWQYNNIFLFKI